MNQAPLIFHKLLNQPATKTEVELYRRDQETVFYNSRYSFLMGHKGLRKNALHGIMSTMGSGKSTLFKGIIAEAALQAKVLVWLSEESVVEYQSLISYMDEECLKNIIFINEKEIPDEYKTTQDRFFEIFEQMVEDSGAEFVFIDNITTSAFYNQRFGFIGQNRSADFLHGFVKRKCSIFYVAHTESSVTDNSGKIVTPENIRGSKELPIVTEYFYIVQKFTKEDRQYNLLRVAKFRHHKDAGGWFSLVFSDGCYVDDNEVPFAVVNAIFQSRDYLGKSTK